MKEQANRLRRAFPGLAVVASLVVLGGCAATTNIQQIDKLESVDDSPTIALIPPDIRYYLLTTGGVPEPNADWTESAQNNFLAATLDYAESIGADVMPVDKNDLGENEIRYETLHSTVGSTILTNHFGMFTLPSKAGAFDWTLGPGVSAIGERYDADYALFVYYRDYQASGGRVAMSIFTTLLSQGGVVPGMGQEQGFASLVDLTTGDIVWFNVVVGGSGEMRDPEGAARAVRGLFKDIPTRRGNSEAP